MTVQQKDQQLATSTPLIDASNAISTDVRRQQAIFNTIITGEGSDLSFTFLAWTSRTLQPGYFRLC